MLVKVVLCGLLLSCPTVSAGCDFVFDVFTGLNTLPFPWRSTGVAQREVAAAFEGYAVLVAHFGLSFGDTVQSVVRWSIIGSC